jgi:hypothetical protein
VRFVVPFLAVLAIALPGAVRADPSSGCPGCTERCVGAPAFLERDCPDVCRALCRSAEDADAAARGRAQGVVEQVGTSSVGFVVPTVASDAQLWKALDVSRLPLIARWSTRAKRIDLRARLIAHGIMVKRQVNATAVAQSLSSALEYLFIPYLLAQPELSEQVLRRRDPRGLRVARKHIHVLSAQALALCAPPGAPPFSPLLQAAGWIQKAGTFEEALWPFTAWSPSDARFRSCAEAATDARPRADAEPGRPFVIDQFYYLPGVRQAKASARRASDLRAILARGYPIVLTLWAAAKDWQKARVDVPRERPRTVHTVLLVGFDEPKHQFVFVNSWGTEWGNRGFGTLSDRYVERFALEAVFVRSVRIKREAPAEAER